MRQIKFRIWSKNAGKMLNYYEFGGNVHPVQDTQTCIELRHPVSVILMQYTGLKDKAGTDIYEGDILLYGTVKAEVKYDPELAMYHDIFGFTFSSMARRSKIIGTVHGNPKLLTKKNKK